MIVTGHAPTSENVAHPVVSLQNIQVKYTICEDAPSHTIWAPEAESGIESNDTIPAFPPVEKDPVLWLLPKEPIRTTDSPVAYTKNTPTDKRDTRSQARRDAFLRMEDEKYTLEYIEVFLIGNRLGKNLPRRIVYSMCTTT